MRASHCASRVQTLNCVGGDVATGLGEVDVFTTGIVPAHDDLAIAVVALRYRHWSS
jgi:hypothetical protein